ncbi:MAG: hypothetical protein MUC38_14700 [Cyclobacteriaceae bacterium]|jgi:hypothetical protein|nr:hypothetical protein [Cyclobacteriaceae bacterium]
MNHFFQTCAVRTSVVTAFVLCLGSSCSRAQAKTTSFTVVGAVAAPVTFSSGDIQRLAPVSLGDVTITNHLGEQKKKLLAVEGVPLVELLKTVTITAENPRALSEYYFVFIAKDDYRVVFSWNELFNNPAGQRVFLVTACQGKRHEALEDGLLLLVPDDLRTGRRHIKSLDRIEIKRAR